MQKIIIGNWKMYPTLSDTSVLAASLRTSLDTIKGAEIVIAPPTAWLLHVMDIWKTRPGHVHFAVQNIWSDDQGAYTGEISAYMLKDLVGYAIIGHSERRQYQKEESEMLSEKIKACLKWKIKPILCVGETKKVIEDGKVNSYQWSKLSEQLEDGLEGISKDMIENVIIAYEPVWAIGTSNPATPEYTAEVVKKMRALLAEKYGEKTVEELPFLYGGSVSAHNAGDYLRNPEIAGLLVGGASVKAKDFTEICQIASRVNH